MKAMHVGVGLVLVVWGPALAGATALAQQIPGPPTTAAAEVTQCAQAQMVVDQLLAAGMQRLDVARQSNAAADLRAAVDTLQNTMRDARAQLAPCAAAYAKAQTDAHAGHSMSAAPAPGVQPPAPAPMDHSKMPMGTAAPAKSPGSKPGSVAKPPAPMDHSKMPVGKPPAAKPAPVKGKPGPAEAQVDHSKMPMPTSEAGAKLKVDPVCGLKVNPTSSPQAVHGGKTHHFCSELHRQLFQKNPSKYLPKGT